MQSHLTYDTLDNLFRKNKWHSAFCGGQMQAIRNPVLSYITITQPDNG